MPGWALEHSSPSFLHGNSELNAGPRSTADGRWVKKPFSHRRRDVAVQNSPIAVGARPNTRCWSLGTSARGMAPHAERPHLRAAGAQAFPLPSYTSRPVPTIVSVSEQRAGQPPAPAGQQLFTSPFGSTRVYPSCCCPAAAARSLGRSGPKKIRQVKTENSKRRRPSTRTAAVATPLCRTLGHIRESSYVLLRNILQNKHDSSYI